MRALEANIEGAARARSLEITNDASFEQRDWQPRRLAANANARHCAKRITLCARIFGRIPSEASSKGVFGTGARRSGLSPWNDWPMFLHMGLNCRTRSAITTGMKLVMTFVVVVGSSGSLDRKHGNTVAMNFSVNEVSGYGGCE